MRFVFLICVAVLFCNIFIASASGCSAPECINNGNADHSTVILCNKCLLDSGSYSRVLRHKLKSIGVKNDGPTQISDLNFDVLVLILENLDTEDILNLAKADSDPTILDAVKHAFWHKYRDYSVHVGTYDFEKDIYSENGFKDIFISKKGMKILRIIGSGIRYLKMSSPPAFVNECINRYVGDSLIELELKELDSSFTPGTFRHLKSLQLKNDHLTDDQIEIFFSKNPQIQNVSISSLSQNVSNAMNRHLLNLENLTVSTIDIKNFTRFEHLKHLAVLSSQAGTVNKMSCPQIQSLEMRFARNLDFSQPWAQFLAKHQTLTHLEILECPKYFDNNPGLVLLTTLSGSLTDIIIDGIGSISIETFSKIIENNPELERLCVLHASLSSDSEQIFREKFGNDWSINEINDLILKKKH